MGRLDGKVAVVTSASSALGRTTALTLAREGELVVAADTDGPKAIEAVAQDDRRRRGDGHQPSGPIPAVLTTWRRCWRRRSRPTAASTSCTTTRRISPRHAPDPDADTTVVDLDLEAWEQTLRVQLRATMLGCRYAVPHLIRSGGGSIVNGSSTEGLAGDITGTGFGTSAAGINRPDDVRRHPIRQTERAVQRGGGRPHPASGHRTHRRRGHRPAERAHPETRRASGRRSRRTVSRVGRVGLHHRDDPAGRRRPDVPPSPLRPDDGRRDDDHQNE